MRLAPPTVALALLIMAGCTPEETGPPPNMPPLADAGSDITQPADEAVTLDGRASHDPDATAETTLTFHWSFDYTPPGSELATKQSAFIPNNDTTGTTTFQPDVVGTYVVELMVNDGKASSEPAYAVVTATESVNKPMANAGSDQTIELGETASLDGRQSSDPLGGELSFDWSLSNVPYNSSLALGDVNLTGANQPAMSFVPDVTGVFTASLVVSNTMDASEADSANVTVTGDNEAPTAEAGEDQLGEDCTFISLSASSSSDPEGAPLSYFWELQSKPAESMASNSSFGDRLAMNTTFWADEAGDYLLSVSVFDGTTWSSPDLVNLTLAERAANAAPSVDAGADRVESAGDAECEPDGYVYDCEDCPSLRVDLGADGSITDADDDPYTLAWVLVDGDATIVHDDRFPAQAVLDETAPEEPGACVETPFTFQLTVEDCPHAVVTDEVIVSTECCGVSSGTGS